MKARHQKLLQERVTNKEECDSTDQVNDEARLTSSEGNHNHHAHQEHHSLPQSPRHHQQQQSPQRQHQSPVSQGHLQSQQEQESALNSLQSEDSSACDSVIVRGVPPPTAKKPITSSPNQYPSQAINHQSPKHSQPPSLPKQPPPVAVRTKMSSSNSSPSHPTTITSRRSAKESTASGTFEDVDDTDDFEDDDAFQEETLSFNRPSTAVYNDRRVGFSPEITDRAQEQEDEQHEDQYQEKHDKLHRRDTPHHLKNKRINLSNSKADEEKVAAILAKSVSPESPMMQAVLTGVANLSRQPQHSTASLPRQELHRETASSTSSILPVGPVEIKYMKIEVIKTPHGSLGFSIAGGAESDPYKEGDTGIFVSKITEGGAAATAGLMVSDKILSVNDHKLIDVKHHDAVRILKSCGSRFVVQIEREVPLASTPAPSMTSLMMSLPQQPVVDQPPFAQQSLFTSHLHQQEPHSGVLRQYSSPSTVTSVLHSNGDIVMPSKKTSPNSKATSMAQHSSSGMTRNPVVVPSPRTATRTSSVTLSAAKSVDLLSTHASEVPRPEMLLQKGDTKVMIFHTTLIRDSNGLGFSIKQQSDGDDSAFFISRIAEGGAADKDGKVKIGDQILKIGPHEVTGAAHRDVVSWLMKTDRFVRLVLQREVDPSTNTVEEALFSRERSGSSLSASASRSNLSMMSGGMYSSNSYMANRPNFAGSYRRPTLGSMGSMSSLSERGGNAVDPSSSPGTPVPQNNRYSIHTRLPGLRNNTGGDGLLTTTATLPSSSRVTNIVANINSGLNNTSPSTLPRDFNPSSSSFNNGNHSTSSLKK